MTDRKYSYLWLPGAFFMAWVVFSSTGPLGIICLFPFSILS
jgi:hypothetical protein